MKSEEFITHVEEGPLYPTGIEIAKNGLLINEQEQPLYPTGVEVVAGTGSTEDGTEVDLEHREYAEDNEPLFLPGVQPCNGCED